MWEPFPYQASTAPENKTTRASSYPHHTEPIGNIIYIYIYGIKYGKIPTPKIGKHLVGVAIYGRMPASDAWNMFIWTFQDFNFEILKS